MHAKHIPKTQRQQETIARAVDAPMSITMGLGVSMMKENGLSMGLSVGLATGLMVSMLVVFDEWARSRISSYSYENNQVYVAFDTTQGQSGGNELLATVRVMLLCVPGGLQTYGSAAIIIGDCCVMFVHCPQVRSALRSDDSF